MLGRKNAMACVQLSKCDPMPVQKDAVRAKMRLVTLVLAVKKSMRSAASVRARSMLNFTAFTSPLTA